MATRSRIARLNNDGSITSIYCHFDGYLSHAGKILLEHYSTQDKVNALISLGDLSILGESLGEKHDFDSHYDSRDKCCLAYGRDRGEKNVEAKNSKNHAAFLDMADGCCAEYVYLFDGEWSYLRLRDGQKLQPLTQEACQND